MAAREVGPLVADVRGWCSRGARPWRGRRTCRDDESGVSVARRSMSWKPEENPEPLQLRGDRAGQRLGPAGDEHDLDVLRARVLVEQARAWPRVAVDGAHREAAEVPVDRLEAGRIERRGLVDVEHRRRRSCAGAVGREVLLSRLLAFLTTVAMSPLAAPES